jgi:hypothetical protein
MPGITRSRVATVAVKSPNYLFLLNIFMATKAAPRACWQRAPVVVFHLSRRHRPPLSPA